MNREELEPMDRELAALLAVKKTVPEPDEAVRARVRGSVLAQVGGMAMGRAAKGGGGAGPGDVVRRLVGAHPLASVVGALAVGVSVGAVVVAPRLAEEKVVYVDRVAPVVSVVAPPTVVAVPTRETVPAVRVPEAVTPLPHAKADGALDSQRLASERALLDIARAALSRGEAATAIDAAKRHEQEFPSGQLAEEREAILIRALVQVGDGREARARATKFHARFPESIFGRTIDAAVATIP